ncbi:hypothetical protein FG386_002299 [Cryptosporidium ryanae]|uniref:uncharacterized protein n=1 Tax=Cryptosporidium ryanae TaxID=515981 RepID=UPI00351A71AC|nr:hypothetical protein FG386_002299 [Cryptosporidium ryanae]
MNTILLITKCILLFVHATLKFEVSRKISVECSEIRGPIVSSKSMQVNYYLKKAGLNKVNDNEHSKEAVQGKNENAYSELISELIGLPEASRSLLFSTSVGNQEDFFENVVYVEKDEGVEYNEYLDRLCLNKDELGDSKDKTLLDKSEYDNSTGTKVSLISSKVESRVYPLYYKKHVPKVSIEELLTYFIHPTLLIADFLDSDMDSELIIGILDSVFLKHQNETGSSNDISYVREKGNYYNFNINKLKKKFLDKDNIYLILNSLILRKKNGSLPILKRLIQYGLDIKVFKRFPELFTLAVRNSNYSLVEFILWKMKPEREEVGVQRDSTSSHRSSPPTLSPSLVSYNSRFASNKPEFDSGDVLVRQQECDSGNLVNTVDNYNHTSLYYAVEKNDLEMASILISRGACVNMWDPRTGSNALMMAMRNHNGAMIGLIMDNGGDPLRISPVSGMDVMDVAIMDNDLKMIEKIVNHRNYDINTVNNDFKAVIMEYAAFDDNVDIELINKMFKKKFNKETFVKQLNDYEKEAKHILGIIKTRSSDSILSKLLKIESKKKIAILCSIEDGDGRGVFWWSAYYGNLKQIQYILDFYSKAIRNRWVGYKNCNPHKEDKYGIYPLNLIVRKTLKFPKKLVIDILQFRDPKTSSSLMLQILSSSKQPLRALKDTFDTLRNKFNISYSFFNIWSDDKLIIDPIYFAMCRQLSPSIIHFLLEIATNYADEIVGTTSKWKSKVIHSIHTFKNVKNLDISSIIQLQEGNFGHLEHEIDSILHSQLETNILMGARSDKVKPKSNGALKNEKSPVMDTKLFFSNNESDLKNMFDNKWRTNIVHTHHDSKDSKKSYRVPPDSIPYQINPPTLKSLLFTKRYTSVDKSSENIARIIIGRGPSHKIIDNIRTLVESSVGIGIKAYSCGHSGAGLDSRSSKSCSKHLISYSHSCSSSSCSDRRGWEEEEDGDEDEDRLGPNTSCENGNCHSHQSDSEKKTSDSVFSSIRKRLNLSRQAPNYEECGDRCEGEPNGRSPVLKNKRNVFHYGQKNFIYPFGGASIDVIRHIVDLRPETIGEVLTRVDYSSFSDSDKILALLQALPRDFPPFDAHAFSPLQVAANYLYRYQQNREILIVLGALFSQRYIRLFSKEQITEVLNTLALVEYWPSDLVELFGGVKFKKNGLDSAIRGVSCNGDGFNRCEFGLSEANGDSGRSLEGRGATSEKYEDEYEHNEKGGFGSGSKGHGDGVSNMRKAESGVFREEQNVYNMISSMIGRSKLRSIKLDIIDVIDDISGLPWDKNLTDSDLIFCVFCMFTVIFLLSIYFNSNVNYYTVCNSMNNRLLDISNKYNCQLPLLETGSNFVMDFGILYMFNVPYSSSGKIKSAIWNSIKACFLVNKLSDFPKKKYKGSNDAFYESFQFAMISFVLKFSGTINAIKFLSVLMFFVWVFVSRMYEEMALLFVFTAIAITVYSVHGQKLDSNMYYQLNSCFKYSNNLLIPEIMILYEQTNNHVIKYAKRAIALHFNLKKSSANANSRLVNESSKYINKLEFMNQNFCEENTYTEISEIGFLEITKHNHNKIENTNKCYRLLFITNLVCIVLSFLITFKLPLECLKNQTSNKTNLSYNNISDFQNVLSAISTCRKLYQFQYSHLYQLTRFYPILVSYLNFVAFLYYWQLLLMMASPILSLTLSLYHFKSLASIFNSALSTPINILLPNARASKMIISQTFSSREPTYICSSAATNVNCDRSLSLNMTNKSMKVASDGKRNSSASSFAINSLKPNTGYFFPESEANFELNGTKRVVGGLDSSSFSMFNNHLSQNQNASRPCYGQMTRVEKQTSNPEIRLKNMLYSDFQIDSNDLECEFPELNRSAHNPYFDDDNSEVSYYKVLEAQIYPFFIWADSRKNSHKICKYFWKPIDKFKDYLAVATIALVLFFYYVELTSSPVKNVRLWEIISPIIFILGLSLLYNIHIMVDIHRETLEFWQWVPDVYDILPICSNLLSSVENTMRLLPSLTSPFSLLNIPVTYPLFFISIIFYVISINIYL